MCVFSVACYHTPPPFLICLPPLTDHRYLASLFSTAKHPTAPAPAGPKKLKPRLKLSKLDKLPDSASNEEDELDVARRKKMLNVCCIVVSCFPFQGASICFCFCRILYLTSLSFLLLPHTPGLTPPSLLRTHQPNKSRMSTGIPIAYQHKK